MKEELETDAQPLPLVSYFDDPPQVPGCLQHWYQQEQQTDRRGCVFILRQVWGEVTCGETVLGRYLGARDGTPTIISPTLQTKTQRSHLLKVIWLVSERVRCGSKSFGWHSPSH